VFLQGGPGFPAGRPVSADSGWVKRALETHRVFLLDQRGTGRSTAVTWESLLALGHAQKQADYVACMRADSIVKDCEVIRKTVLGSQTKWTALGQSFGGFCIMTYLSQAPDGLASAMLTGGLPPVSRGCSADEVSR
jgi:pimeloyl-ACP methyl ester carboxylesterase